VTDSSVVQITTPAPADPHTHKITHPAGSNPDARTSLPTHTQKLSELTVQFTMLAPRYHTHKKPERRRTVVQFFSHQGYTHNYLSDDGSNYDGRHKLLLLKEHHENNILEVRTSVDSRVVRFDGDQSSQIDELA
jgi:hypothetical protein